MSFLCPKTYTSHSAALPIITDGFSMWTTLGIGTDDSTLEMRIK